jgi:MYCBP-associated protein family
MLRPGEHANFTFTFHSDNAGHFHSNFELETDPQLVNPLPIIELSGYAMLDDDKMDE